MSELLKGVGLIHKAMPGGIKPILREKKTANFAFASVVSNSNIKKGDILNKNNIWVRRPGSGDYRAEEYHSLLGKKVKRNIKKNTQIKKIHFK